MTDIQNRILRNQAQHGGVDQKQARKLEKLEQMNQVSYQHLQSRLHLQGGSPDRGHASDAQENTASRLNSLGKQSPLTFGIDQRSERMYEKGASKMHSHSLSPQQDMEGHRQA